jgi:hypothetical protein
MYDWAEFRHFRYLLKILEMGGFRVAAEELRTSQPNLTVSAGLSPGSPEPSVIV